MIEQFHRYWLPTFGGGSNQLPVEEWTRGSECILRHIACNDAQKVQCAKIMLIGAAGHWWESASRTRTKEQHQNLKWDQFKVDVMENIFLWL